jgi:hypothetical protein
VGGVEKTYKIYFEKTFFTAFGVPEEKRSSRKTRILSSVPEGSDKVLRLTIRVIPERRPFSRGTIDDFLPDSI